MEISVEPPDIINVIAPINATEEAVMSKVKSKANWIVKTLYAMKDIKFVPIKREIVNGESFMYLGRNYSFQIQISSEFKSPKVELNQGKFYCYTPTYDEQSIHQAMEEWYRQKAFLKIKEKVKHYEKKFHIKPSVIQQKRWASCTSKNELLFNWKCIMAPSPVLDYIVVHEMCHMYEKNHSKKFWEMLASIMPDFAARKEWLKNNGIRMDL